MVRLTPFSVFRTMPGTKGKEPDMSDLKDKAKDEAHRAGKNITRSGRP
jgi:hypothetical protein